MISTTSFKSKVDGNMISTTSFKSNYHDNYKCTHTSLFNNQFGNSENSLLDKSLQWMFLLCGNQSFDLQCLSTDCFFSRWEWLLRGFFEQAIRYHFLLAWHFLNLIFYVLLIIFKYLVYLVFFIKCFFGTQDCAFPVSRGWVDFAHCNPGVMFTDVASWSLRLFLNIPVYWKVLHFQRCPLIWSIIVGQWGVLTIDTLLVN